MHGNFDLQNMLFDPDTMKIIALLDFDFAHVASPLDGYFWSFRQLHGLLAALTKTTKLSKPCN